MSVATAEPLPEKATVNSFGARGMIVIVSAALVPLAVVTVTVAVPVMP